MPTKAETAPKAERDGERVIRLPLPPAPKADRRLLYYGAIGGLAIIEIIEWPVAIVVGVTYAMLSRNRRRQP